MPRRRPTPTLGISRRSRIARLAAAVGAAAAAAARPAAADVYWKSNASGNFATGSNWVGGVVPGTGSVADFAVANGGFYTVSLTGNVTTAGLVDQAGDQPVLNLAGHTWTVTNGSDDALVVGPAANDFGILQVGGGTLVTTDSSATQTSLGRVANSAGYLYLNNGTTWTNNGPVDAGESGTGNLYVGGTNATATATVNGTLSVGQNAGATGTVYLYAGSTLASNSFVNVGNAGTGNLYQYGGTHTVASNLGLASLGSSTGYYELDGGTLAVRGYEFIGFEGTGGGTFIQNGGTHTVGTAAQPLAMTLAQYPGSTGKYQISGGTLHVFGQLADGVAGYATVDLYGPAAVTVDGGVDLALSAGQGAALFIGAGASLTENNVEEHIGDQGGGNLTQVGGTHTVNARLVIGYAGSSDGSYNLLGGAVTVNGDTIIGYSGYGQGVFEQGLQAYSASTATFNGDLNVGFGTTSYGQYYLAASNGYAATMTVAGNETVGAYATGVFTGGTFNQSGGTQTVGTASAPRTLTVAAQPQSTGLYLLYGGTATVNGAVVVGGAGTGTFNQSGGTLVVNNAPVALPSGDAATGLIVGGTAARGVGTCLISGGTATLSNLYAGYYGTGTVNQSGGTVTTPYLVAGYMPGGTGTYLLSANGKLNVTTNEYVGYGGTGTFNQTGGTHTVAGNLEVGSYPGPVAGTFSLSGGSVTAGGVDIATAAGSANAWVQTGGTLTTSGGLSVGYLGAGAVNQSAGTVNVPANDLYVGSQANSAGVYRLSGTGSLAVADRELVGNAGTGSVVQTGGSNVVYDGAGTLVLGNAAGATGSYAIAAGTLSVATTLVVAGPGATGSLTYNGSAAVVVGGTTPPATPALYITPAGTLATYGTATVTGSVPLVNNGTVHVAGGTFALNVTAPFTNAGSVAVDAGAVAQISAAVSGTGTIVDNGQLYLNASSTVGRLTGTGTLDVGYGGSAVTVSAAGPVVAQNVVNVAAGSALDLGTAGLILHATPLAVATAQAAAGYAGGTWAGTGGVTSAAAAADPRRLTAVGVIQDAATPGGTTPLYPTFAGQPAAATDVLARLTYYGDANLDGLVNGADYARIDAGYNGRGTLTGWANGDFNYDGRVDASDYTLIDNAFDLQGSALTPPPNAIVAASTAEVAAVPEPAGVATVAGAVAALTLARRRRRVTARTR